MTDSIYTQAQIDGFLAGYQAARDRAVRDDANSDEWLDGFDMFMNEQIESAIERLASALDEPSEPHQVSVVYA